MNRFDSAYASGRRRAGLWLRALLLVMLTTAGLLSSSSVMAQSTVNLATPAAVCAGQNVTFTTTLTPVGSATYNNAGAAYAAPLLPGAVVGET